jgi:hypothetical protein
MIPTSASSSIPTIASTSVAPRTSTHSSRKTGDSRAIPSSRSAAMREGPSSTASASGASLKPYSGAAIVPGAVVAPNALLPESVPLEPARRICGARRAAHLSGESPSPPRTLGLAPATRSRRAASGRPRTMAMSSGAVSFFASRAFAFAPRSRSIMSASREPPSSRALMASRSGLYSGRSSRRAFGSAPASRSAARRARSCRLIASKMSADTATPPLAAKDVASASAVPLGQDETPEGLDESTYASSSPVRPGTRIELQAPQPAGNSPAF